MWKFGAIFAVVAGAHAALAEPISIRERGDHVTEGVATIDASPQQVYDLVTDYAHWRDTLTDIVSVNVVGGDRDHAHVRFKSNALGHKVTVAFTNEPGRLIKFVGIEGPPGGRAHGDYTLVAVDGGRRTRVTATLYMDVKGAASLFVSDRKIQGMRQAKLRADLTDVAQHFGGARSR
jgi:carbon monoxide dehydrogenase subunit G